MSNISGFVKKIRDIMRNDSGVNGDAQRIEQIVWILFLKVYDIKEEDWEMDSDYTSIIPENLRWRNWVHNKDVKDDITGDVLLNFINNELFPKLKTLEVTPETPVRQSIVRSTFEEANNYMKDGVLLRQVINVIDELKFESYDDIHAFGDIYESILKELQSAGSSGEFYTPRAVTDFMAKMIKPQIGETMADFACGTGGFLCSWVKELEKIKDSRENLKNEETTNVYNSVYGIEKKQFPYMLCITNMLLHGVENPSIYHMNSLGRQLLSYTERDCFDVILMNPPYGGNEQNNIKKNFPDDLQSSETADLFMSVILYRLKKNGRAAVIIPDGFLFGNDSAKMNIKRKLLTEFDLHTVIRMPASVFAPYTSITTNILFFDNKEPSGETWFYRIDIPDDRKHFSKTKPMELKHFDKCIEWWNDRKEIEDEDGNPKAKKYTTQELVDNNYNFDLCGYPHEEEVILSVAETIQNYEEERTKLNNDIDRLLAEITDLHEKAQKGEL